MPWRLAYHTRRFASDNPVPTEGPSSLERFLGAPLTFNRFLLLFPRSPYLPPSLPPSHYNSPPPPSLSISLSLFLPLCNVASAWVSPAVLVCSVDGTGATKNPTASAGTEDSEGHLPGNRATRMLISQFSISLRYSYD